MCCCRSASPGGSAPAERDRAAADDPRGRARRVRARLSAPAVGRHADARLDRPRARHRPRPAAARRAVRRARRDHPASALNDDLLRLWEARRPTVVFVTHSVFESVYLSTRIAVMTRAAGADRRRSAGRPAAAARSARSRTRAGIRARCATTVSRRRSPRAMAAGGAAMSDVAPRRWRDRRRRSLVGAGVPRRCGRRSCAVEGIPPYILPGADARSRRACGPTGRACSARCW